MSGRKTAFAITAFDDRDRLSHVIQDLEHLGLGSEHILLLASRSALDGHLAETVGSNFAGSVQIVWPERPTRGVLAAQFFDRQVLAFEEWIPEEFSDELRQHLVNGGCILFAEIMDDDQGRDVGEILLRHSANAVQFHDFTRRF